MNDAFFVDPESLACVVVRDVPAGAGAVLSNGAGASSLVRVSAAGSRAGRAHAKNLEPQLQVVVSVTGTGAMPQISSAYWRTVRSLENSPIRAVLVMDMRVQVAWSRWVRATSS